MIEHRLDKADSILYVRPKSKLEESDFVPIRETSNPHIEERGDLAGLIIEVTFLSWMGEPWGNGGPFSLCARSPQANQEDRRRNRFPHGKCR